MNTHLKKFEEIYAKELKLNNKFPEFKAGDTIEVKIKIEEGGKVRTQIFQGIVIQRRHPGTTNETFTVRKLVGNVAVERIFPISSPIILGITVIKRGIVRRARLFYLRDPKFKKKIKNKFISNKNKKNKENKVEVVENKKDENADNINKVDENTDLNKLNEQNR